MDSKNKIEQYSEFWEKAISFWSWSWRTRSWSNLSGIAFSGQICQLPSPSPKWEIVESFCFSGGKQCFLNTTISIDYISECCSFRFLCKNGLDQERSQKGLLGLFWQRSNPSSKWRMKTLPKKPAGKQSESHKLELWEGKWPACMRRSLSRITLIWEPNWIYPHQRQGQPCQHLEF